MVDNTRTVIKLASPCCRKCCLDDQDICIGCFRTIKEICAWNASDNAERLAVKHRAQLRKIQNGP